MAKRKWSFGNTNFIKTFYRRKFRRLQKNSKLIWQNNLHKKIAIYNDFL